jgi:hypothetical protein
MLDPPRTTGPRKVSKEPAASALTETPRVTGPGAECFGIQEQPKTLSPAASPPTVPDDWGDGLIDLIAKPGWEHERAKTLLRTGSTIPEIIRHFVAKGLSQETAIAIVDRALEDRAREQFDSLREADRTKRVDLALFAVAGCVITGIGSTLFPAFTVRILVACMASFLVAVWLGHWMAERGHGWTPRTRGIVVRWILWTGFVTFVLRFFIVELFG